MNMCIDQQHLENKTGLGNEEILRLHKNDN